MTRNAAAKKAAREHAIATGTSYTAARRITRNDASAERSSVWVTLEFTGPNAPAPFQVDATWWLDDLRWHHVVSLKESGWVHAPSGPDSLVNPPEPLAMVADQAPQLEVAAAWVRENTVSVYEVVSVPDQYSPTGEATSAASFTTYPYRMVFDREAAQTWLAARGPLYHLTLSDFVTPSERRAWLELDGYSAFDCAAGKHHFDGTPSPYMGECSGCGAMMLVKYTYDGDEYEAIVEEGEFFAEAAATEAACNWAPPTTMLEGETQSEWHERNRSPFTWD